MKATEEKIENETGGDMMSVDEYRNKIADEETFLEIEDKGKKCSIANVKVIKKEGNEMHLATLKMEDGSMRKKWLGRTDKQVIRESDLNAYVVGSERSGSRIYMCLKPASPEEKP